MRKAACPLVSLVLFACDRPPVAPEPAVGPSFESQGVQYRVSVGSPDACEAFGSGPGCDGNFSLVASMGPNGVQGQWQDDLPGGHHGIHVQVNCLVVEGRTAWLSGLDRDGNLWMTQVQDNGASARDWPDQISWSWGPYAPGQTDCTERPWLPLFATPQGQVVVTTVSNVWNDGVMDQGCDTWDDGSYCWDYMYRLHATETPSGSWKYMYSAQGSSLYVSSDWGTESSEWASRQAWLFKRGVEQVYSWKESQTVSGDWGTCTFTYVYHFANGKVTRSLAESICE